LRTRGAGFILNHIIPVPLNAYFDAFDDAAADHTELPVIDNVTWVNLSKVQPWAHEYLVANFSTTSPTQRSYSGAGGFQFRECVVRTPPSVSLESLPAQRDCHNGRCTGDICRDAILILKVAAFYDALTTFAGRYLIWLDSDAFFQRAPDQAFYDWMAKFDVATIFRGRNNPETGVVGFSVTNASRDFAARMRDVFYHYAEKSYAGVLGLNDMHFFRFFLMEGHTRLRHMRVGHFGVACRPTNSQLPWVRMSQSYGNSPPFECPRAAHAFVSPFNLFQYVTHCKSSGPTTQSGVVDTNAKYANRCT